MRPTRAILLLTLASSFAVAQSRKPVAPAHKAVAEPPATSTLPVTRVALYKNGVGFFEHSGHVTGSQAVTIDFTTAQLNDVLQSLTAIDLNGGRIAGAGYNSTTPLEQQLRSLPLGLDADPTTADFYNAIRGARVEVHSAAVSITGRLLNIELIDTPAGDNQPAHEKRLITVVGDSGEVRTLELTSATEVRLLDTDLHTDVTRYLELLASTRNQGLRHLTLQDNAPDVARTPRELHVSYLSEVPIWKSTYRILLTSPKPTASPTTQTATLQGWSVVDNTTGEDWNNVHLSLIAGAPQSFIQPLSQPIYSRRPEIPISQEAQLTPQTHESGDLASPMVVMHKADGVAGMAGLSAGPMGGVMRGIGSGNGSGIGPGSGGNYGGGVALAALSDDNASASVLSGPLFQQAARASLNPNTTTAAFDDYFAYNITDPITIRKNESALVPILQTKIDAERVTLWSLQQPVPLRALWITNTSDFTLDRGSFSIVEDGNFGGEGLLDPIHPAEKRLLSYAVDQAVRVSTESNGNSSRVTSITAAKGVLALHRTQVTEITYVVHNAAPEPRMVVIEHPIHQNYTLDSDPKPFETTPTLYRFRVLTGPGEKVALHVGERHPTTSNYQLTRSDDNQFTLILNEVNHNPALEAAIQPILAARRRVADAQSALDKISARLTELRADEERQRSNVTALANADKASRDRFVHDLNTTEDQIAVNQKDLAAAQVALQATKDDLANKIEALQIDEKL